jgi:hypothetical protein
LRDDDRVNIVGAGEGDFARPRSSSIHDLRRSFSTGLGDLGVPPHIIETLINHQSGTKASVSGRYNLGVYERQGRQAVELWGTTVMAAIEGERAPSRRFIGAK